MTGIIVIGAAGRMGTQIIASLGATQDVKLVGAIEAVGSPALGKETGGVRMTDSLDKIMSQADVVIDFTSPTVTISNLEIVAKYGKSAVVGTTGHSAEQKKSIESLAKKIPIVMASNMSVGVNVMWKVIAEAAKALGPSFDIEVLEMHHHLKKDAPSGTTMTTAEVLAKATGRDLTKDAITHREGIIGERKPNEIGIQTLRGGDIVGDHTVYFAGNGEMLTVTHRATSRDTFAQGAIRAAEWVTGKKPGLYSMADVLDLRS